ALTQPEALKQWMGPSDEFRVLVAETDVRIGGRYHIVMKTPGGEEHDVSGLYREIVPNRKLAYTWAWKSTPEREAQRTIEQRPAAASWRSGKRRSSTRRRATGTSTAGWAALHGSRSLSADAALPVVTHTHGGDHETLRISALAQHPQGAGRRRAHRYSSRVRIRGHHQGQVAHAGISPHESQWQDAGIEGRRLDLMGVERDHALRRQQEKK